MIKMAKADRYLQEAKKSKYRTHVEEAIRTGNLH